MARWWAPKRHSSSICRPSEILLAPFDGKTRSCVMPRSLMTTQWTDVFGLQQSHRRICRLKATLITGQMAKHEREHITRSTITSSTP